jgi:hypothetical protein
VNEDVHLFLVGDDEALDLLAEMTRYLPVYELARVDVVPDDLPSSAVVVIGATHPRLRDARLAEAMAQKTRHIALVPEAPGGVQPGARALVVAAELVALLMPELVSKQPA